MNEEESRQKDAPDGDDRLEKKNAQPSYNSIRLLYEEYMASIGQGENGLFHDAPGDAILKNMHPLGHERPLFYVGEDGRIKPWLTNGDLEKIPKSELIHNPELHQKVMYDMFSLMVGGILPSLADLGLASLSELIKSYIPDDRSQKLLKVASFIDQHDTSLTEWMYRRVGLPFTVRGFYKAVVANQEKKALVMGDGSANGNVTLVWHPVRNMRSGTPSPVRSDGSGYLGVPFDMMLLYAADETDRATRLNSTVFALARHGLSEDETELTESDQVYISLDEYHQRIYIADDQERNDAQRTREENFIINNRTQGYEDAQELRKRKIAEALTQIKEEDLDHWIAQIDEYLESE